MYRLMLMFVATVVLSSACKKEEVDQLAVDIEKIEQYISTNGLNAERLPSGVYIVKDREGVGTEQPTGSSLVDIFYRGYLLDGTVFDERWPDAVDPEDRKSTVLSLSNVIDGWKIGIPQFKRGGKGKILIPSTLGYGPRGIGAIPSNSVLIFDVELVDF